jgi:hypothetical protein
MLLRPAEASDSAWQLPADDTIESMDPGGTYCDDDLWANGCTVVAPSPPAPPPSWEPCTNKPEGCYGDPGIGDPGSGGGWSGGGGAGGGGGESGTCPATDPDCPQPLTPSDSIALNQSLLLVRTHFTDPVAAGICSELKGRFADALAANRVRRGNTAIPDGNNDHGGQYYDGIIHIDGDMLDRAASGDPTYKALVAEIALHEAAHMAGYSPHATDGSEIMGSYTTFPYNYASRGPGVSESCVP